MCQLASNFCALFQAGCFNEPVQSAMSNQRNSFLSSVRHSRTSQSFDDLDRDMNSDHYAALNISRSSRHGYAKIRPRNRPSMDTSHTSKSQDMWAYKLDDTSSSIVSPKYLFDHPVYASHSQLDAVPFLNKNLTSRSNNSGVAGRSKVSQHKIGPKTLNPKFVNPYSKVPIKLTNDHSTATNFIPPPPLILPEQSQNRSCGSISGFQLSETFTSSHSSSHSSCDKNMSSFLSNNTNKSEVDYDAEMFSHEDYVDMTSDDDNDDEQSIDEGYKQLTDLAIKHSSFGTG